jgi:hypothetical protein
VGFEPQMLVRRQQKQSGDGVCPSPPFASLEAAGGYFIIIAGTVADVSVVKTFWKAGVDK